MIHLLPLGSSDIELIRWLAGKLREVFKTEVLILPPLPMPLHCYSKRGQFNSTCILSSLNVSERTLAVTEKDLFARNLNFVFGEAELGGLRAIVSYYRLKDGGEKLKERLLKEAVHELGHTYGLAHCSSRGCVMNFSSNVLEVDAKTASFCRKCRSKIG